MSEFKPQIRVFSSKNSGRAVSAGVISVLGVMLSGMMTQPLGAQENMPELDLLQDVPEEVLQTEMILQGRSPLNGEELTPSQYAQLQDRLQVSRGEVPATVTPQIQRLVVLLRLRKVVITLFPFLK